MSGAKEIARETLEVVVNEALSELYEKELPILRLDVAERTICARLAGILERSFTTHSVHAEYNRHGVQPKRIDLPCADGVLTQRCVFPDIIVHQVGHDDENILVIEVKKSSNPASDDADMEKLRHIKEQIGYRHALFMRTSVGPDADRREVRMSWA